MKKISFSLLLLLIAVFTLPSETLSSISQYGITWTFDKAYTCGQYVTGDWWVLIDPVTQNVTVNQVSYESDPDVRGWQCTLNPRWGEQSYIDDDFAIALGYNIASNPLGYNPNRAVTSGNLPLTLTADDILSTAELTTVAVAVDDDTGINNAAILTIVDVAPSATAFRPPYCQKRDGSDNPVYSYSYNTNQIQWSLLPKRVIPGNPSDYPSFNDLIPHIQKPWTDHLGKSTMGMVHPLETIPWYGRDLSKIVSEAAIFLCLNYPQAELEEMTIAMIQLGIDIYGILQDEGEWHADGGHASGRKFPIVFASIFLNDSTMQNFSRTWDDNGRVARRFGEDGQVYYYDDADLPAYTGPPEQGYTIKETSTGPEDHAVKGVRGWIDKMNGGPGDIVLWKLNEATAGHFVGHEHLHVDLWSDVSYYQRKSEAYRVGTTSHTWIGQALAMQLLGQQFLSVWDKNAYFDYCYRWMTQDSTLAQEAFFNKFGITLGEQGFTGSNLIDAVWDAYHDEYITFRLNGAGGGEENGEDPLLIKPTGIRIQGN